MIPRGCICTTIVTKSWAMPSACCSTRHQSPSTPKTFESHLLFGSPSNKGALSDTLGVMQQGGLSEDGHLTGVPFCSSNSGILAQHCDLPLEKAVLGMVWGLTNIYLQHRDH